MPAGERARYRQTGHPRIVGADEYRHGDVNALQILEQQRCADPRCECQFSLIRGRGPSHCPACPSPNLALRVSVDRSSGALRVSCKLGCDQAQLPVALGLVPSRPAESEIGAVTQRLYRRRSCAVCGERLLGRRRDAQVCGDRCRQRRQRALAV
jgi:hypothetical protein